MRVSDGQSLWADQFHEKYTDILTYIEEGYPCNERRLAIWNYGFTFWFSNSAALSRSA
jgi:hypothetical protein